MRFLPMIVGAAVMVCAACASKTLLPDKANFYGQDADQVIATLEKMGLECQKGEFSTPIYESKKDIQCTYIKESWMCPERYRIIMGYSLTTNTISSAANIDRRKLCF